MDDISKLLCEARPMYLYRKRCKQKLCKACCCFCLLLCVFCPIFFEKRYDTNIDSLYSELYTEQTYLTSYYIDEFDAIGVI